MIQKLSFLLWSMWKCRNKVVFSNEIFNPLACLIMAKKTYAEWRIRSCISMDDIFRGPSSTPSIPSHKFVWWYPPNPGWVKLNFEGSSNHYSVRRGFILRDWTGKGYQTGNNKLWSRLKFGSGSTRLKRRAMHGHTSRLQSNMCRRR